MIDWILGFFDKIKFGSRRSSGWQSVRNNHIEVFSRCESCGSEKKLNVHHLKDYSHYPELELEPTNLWTMCRKCHYFVGHLNSWYSLNNNCVEDSKTWLNKIKTRP